jgi:hypothetical protein
VVWERWISKRRVYQKDAVPPPIWDANCSTPAPEKELEVAAQLAAAVESLPAVPGFEKPEGAISNAADEEVRLNKSALEFVSLSRLYSLTEQRRVAATGELEIEFPLNAKEIKAHWIRLDDPADYSRYHTAVGADGANYGLVALHITTKDLPKWFWATFEHVDNEVRWPNAFPQQFAGWSERPRDGFSCEGKPLDCEEFPKNLGLEGTKWENYRLKATQIDWVTEFGDPTRVVNSKIEGGFVQNQSSCISCHSLALIGDNSGPMPYRIFKLPPVGGRLPNFIGVVTQADRVANPENGVETSTNFLQLDFVWSLRNACPEPSDPNRLAGGHCQE